MLGDKIGEESGKITGQKVLEIGEHGPKFEATYQGSGTTLGVGTTVMITYSSVVRPDGIIYGQGQGVLMTQDGEMATVKGEGLARPTGHGPYAASWRGNFYYQTASQKLARLNSIIAVFEYEVDENGNVQGTIWEWK